MEEIYFHLFTNTPNTRILHARIMLGGHVDIVAAHLGIVILADGHAEELALGHADADFVLRGEVAAQALGDDGYALDVERDAALAARQDDAAVDALQAHFLIGRQEDFLAFDARALAS